MLQGNVVTRLGCGGICNDNLVGKLTAGHIGERVLQIFDAVSTQT